MTRLRAAGRQTFSALRVRNYRLFLTAQAVSVTGTWMQTVAQAWLVLRLTDSGVALGVVTALQFLPMLVLGPFAGLVADRADKRRLILATQAVAGAMAVALAALTISGAVQLWMVYVLAFGLGLTSAFDMPARQAFMHEMVGADRLTNAVTLHSVVVNVGRLAGPALGGVLIATVGLGACFALNALTYVAPVTALARMRRNELHPAERAPRRAGQLRQGLAYAWRTPALRIPLLLTAVVGTLSYEFQVSLPLLARFTFGTGAGGYGLLLSAMSVGAVVGGLLVASRLQPSPRRQATAGVALGVVMLAVAAVPTLGLAVALLPLAGLASIVFITQGNASLQLAAEPELRARVIALFGVAFLGSTTVGAPVIGWVGEVAGGRAPLVLGGMVAVGASVVALRALRALPVPAAGAGGAVVPLRPAARPAATTPEAAVVRSPSRPAAEEEASPQVAGAA